MRCFREFRKENDIPTIAQNKTKNDKCLVWKIAPTSWKKVKAEKKK